MILGRGRGGTTRTHPGSRMHSLSNASHSDIVTGTTLTSYSPLALVPGESSTGAIFVTRWTPYDPEKEVPPKDYPGVWEETEADKEKLDQFLQELDRGDATLDRDILTFSCIQPTHPVWYPIAVVRLYVPTLMTIANVFALGLPLSKTLAYMNCPSMRT